MRSCSKDVGFRKNTCSASGAGGSASASARWTTAGSRSRRSRWGSRKRVWTRASRTRAIGRLSAARSAHTRLLTWNAAWLKDEGRDYAAAAASAKLRASDIANICAREAVQIHGGYGYTEEFPVSRYFRDAKVLEIGEGTSEILRLVLSRDLGLEPTT